MEHLAGHTRADGPPVAHENYEHAYNEAYRDEYENREYIANLAAGNYLSGKDTKAWGDMCHAVDLGCEKQSLDVYAETLIGGDTPARKKLIHTLCHDAAVREAELQAGGE